MTFSELVDAQKAGTFKVVDLGSGRYKVGGMAINEEEQMNMLHVVGWRSPVHCKTIDAVKRTDSILRNINNGIRGGKLDECEMRFSCIRFESSVKYCERAVFNSPRGDKLVILHGHTGTGKSFAVYTPEAKQPNVPDGKFSSYKKMCEWLNEYLEENPMQ